MPKPEDINGYLKALNGHQRIGLLQYMKDNCAERQFQLDEGAPLLVHFAVAVLHPIANE